MAVPGFTMRADFSKLRSDEKLLQRLRTAKEPTPAQVKQQRISFVMGSLDSKSTITREQIRQIVEDAA
jgi:hypothetical protein